MNNSMSNIERLINVGEKDAKKAKKEYELLSTYNAYNILLWSVKKEQEQGVKDYYKDSENYFDSYCYVDQIDDLFSLFNENECLKVKNIDKLNEDDKDMIFLINQNTLLRLNSFYAMNSSIDDLANTDYELLKIDNCKAKIYNSEIYHYDSYYCESYYENKKAFGLFDNDSLISQGYILNRRLREYNNMDIRDILKIQSLDDIHDKITEAKNNKVKKLTLNK